MTTRINTLSTRWLKPFKGFVFILYTGIFAVLIVGLISSEHWFSAVFNTGLYGYFLFLLLRMSAKLQHVEFDAEFLYVIGGKQDMIIPLENIESVEIVSLGGVYKVNLYHAEQLGDHFYFKPSLLYPLNYKRKDALVNQLRAAVDAAKRKKTSILTNALRS